MPIFSIDGIYSLNQPLRVPQQTRSSQQNNEIDQPAKEPTTESAKKETTSNEDSKSPSKEQIASDTQEIRKLEIRDKEVHAHEAAHKNSGGKLIRGAAQFTYQKGPDGKQYAVAGEVSIDTSSIPDNPQATLQKANQIRTAALAPTTPSGKDQSVAANAAAMAAAARIEIAKQRAEQTTKDSESTAADTPDQNQGVESTDRPKPPSPNQSNRDIPANTELQKATPLPKYIGVSQPPSSSGVNIDLFA